MPQVEQVLRLGAALALVFFFHIIFVGMWDWVSRARSVEKGLTPGGSLSPFDAKRQSGRNLLFVHFTGTLFGLGCTLLTLNLYVYYGFGLQPDIYRYGNRELPFVALTFDDGPHPVYTPAILDILDTYKVPATFFMVGSHVERYPETAREVVARGHEVGNHTYSHINVPTATTQQLYDQLLRTTYVITDVTGTYPQYIRPPRGLYDGRFRRLADLLGQRVVLWTLSSQDWRTGRNEIAIVSRIVERVKPGDILLFHDSGALFTSEGASRDATVRALPAVIEGVRAKGFEFVSLSTLLEGLMWEPDSHPTSAPEGLEPFLQAFQN